MYLDFYLFIFIFFSTPQKTSYLIYELTVFLMNVFCSLLMVFLYSSLHLLKVLWRVWEENPSSRNAENGGWSFFHWSSWITEAHMWHLTVLILFQALILKELDLVDPEYIGTICGSYRRGDWSFWSTYLTSVII